MSAKYYKRTKTTQTCRKWRHSHSGYIYRLTAADEWANVPAEEDNHQHHKSIDHMIIMIRSPHLSSLEALHDTRELGHLGVRHPDGRSGWSAVCRRWLCVSSSQHHPRSGRFCHEPRADLQRDSFHSGMILETRDSAHSLGLWAWPAGLTALCVDLIKLSSSRSDTEAHAESSRNPEVCYSKYTRDLYFPHWSCFHYICGSFIVLTLQNTNLQSIISICSSDVY